MHLVEFFGEFVLFQLFQDLEVGLLEYLLEKGGRPSDRTVDLVLLHSLCARHVLLHQDQSVLLQTLGGTLEEVYLKYLTFERVTTMCKKQVQYLGCSCSTIGIVHRKM